jgi:hypothetical protein
MLTKPMRTKIREHNWMKIEEADSNPTQTWRRLKDQSIEAINDLILLAQKLPEDKQKEIFTVSMIDNFVRQILYLGGESPAYPDGLNPRKAELAAILVRRGVDVNSYQYLQLNVDTPLLVKPTVDHLRQSSNICNEISYKLKLRNVEEEAEKMKYRYLFSWNNMLGREKRRLLNFIGEKIGGDEYIEIFQGSIKRSDKTIEFKFGQTFEKEEVYGSFHITISDSKNRADITIFDEVNGDVLEMDLLVKETPGDSDFRIYMKRNDRTKK